MPEMDGLETTRLIRKELPNNRQPRIIAMTASSAPEERQACLAAGMDDHMSKPVQLNKIIKVLNWPQGGPS
jgi:CheY-like chemotaxis protein